MNRDDYLHASAKYLGRLTHEIKALNAVGRFDINSVAEDFLVPILKVLFDCPELQNQNEIQQNFPSVDLGCRKSRISFQVTTDASSEKVATTLNKFREHNLQKSFDRVYVLALTEKQSSYKSKSLEKAISELPVPFKIQEHILDIVDILSRIQRLETNKLERIEAYLESEFKKRDKHQQFREQLNKFLDVSQSKIEVEKKSKKYIPSIFVETHTTKEEMRFFVNPLFFCRKLAGKLEKIDYSDLNSLLRLAKEPELKVEIESELLKSVPSTFAELEEWLGTLNIAVDKELKKVGPLSWNHREYGAKYVPVHGKTANWSIAQFRLESVATGLSYLLKDAYSLLHLMRKKIFLITSMAGQGKTNFVCDLIENQFGSFEIPCVFIPSRELNTYPPRQRLLGFISNNRYAPNFENIHECLDLFNKVANDCGKPFLIVIDGINEVNALDEFRDELKDFCNAVCQYDLVKIVITCRSEFFDDRYASILDEPFSNFVHRVTDLRSNMSERSKERLLNSYLDHFNVTGHLSGAAEDFLKNDLLLLRIFCERHEGENVGQMSDVYKGDLFEEFLLRKIRSFPKHLQRKALPTLLKIVSAMLAADDYSKLSVRDLPADEMEIVQHLVADDVILRQELAAKDLSALGDFIISFTYDELRDFIIAYKLIHDATEDSTKALQHVLSRLPSSPIYEGVYKYVYLLARKMNRKMVIDACESADGFIEHFSLNVHLLPPKIQNVNDVTRLKAILADTSVPRRTIRAAKFLLSRRNLAELLNIGILIEHLNNLQTDCHKEFVGTIFGGSDDYAYRDWEERIDELAQNVCDANAQEGMRDYAPEWLAFFLHASSFANWFERERVATLFKNSKGKANCLQALNLVRSAKGQMIREFLSDIEEPEVTQ